MFDSIFGRKAREQDQQRQEQTDDKLARYRALLGNPKPSPTVVDQVVKLAHELGFNADDIDRHSQAIQQVTESDATLADDALAKARKAEVGVASGKTALLAKHDQMRTRLQEEVAEADRKVRDAQGQVLILATVNSDRRLLQEANRALFGLPEPEPEPELTGNVYPVYGDPVPAPEPEPYFDDASALMEAARAHEATKRDVAID